MTTDCGRDPSGQALVASDQAASRLAPTGFDPSRECNILDNTHEKCPRHGHSHSAAGDIAERLSEAQRRCLKVLSEEFKAPPRGHAYWAGSMLYGDKLTRFRYADVRLGNKRLYALTPLGIRVKNAAIAMGARQGGNREDGCHAKHDD